MFADGLNYAAGSTVLLIIDKTTRNVVRYIWAEANFAEAVAKLDTTLFDTLTVDRTLLQPNKNINVSVTGEVTFSDPIPVSTDPTHGAS